MKLEEKISEVLKEGYVCDSCLGRDIAGQLLSGLTNEQRGKILRNFLAFLLDSGEKVEIDSSNFYGIKFRNTKLEIKQPGKCRICRNFFSEQIDQFTENIIKRLDKIEFETFLVGSVPTDEMGKEEEKIFEKIGIEFAETVKSEINREIGKRVEKLTGKRFNLKNPDVVILANLMTNSAKLQIKSLYVYGRYQKLSRGIPQSKWTCSRCHGKGCVECKGKGKLYPISVQEIIEKPLLKKTKAKSSAFHGAGREDIDARMLDYRPFVIELIKPIKRKINLKEILKEINKSKKVKVRNLKFTDKQIVRKIKSERWDKTYLAEVKFKKPIDKKKLKLLKGLRREIISQRTPIRVAHRRADKLRKRRIKEISWKMLDKKTLRIKIRSDAGLYIKELINGDEGRTKPNISEMLDNKVKKISLDVVKIHTKGV